MSERKVEKIMKRFVFLTCIGSLALAVTAWGAPRGRTAHGSAPGGGARSAHVMSARGGSHQVGRVGHAAVSRHFAARPAGRSFARASHSARSRMSMAHIGRGELRGRMSEQARPERGI